MRLPRSEATLLSGKSNRCTRHQTILRERGRTQCQEFEPANSPDEELGRPTGGGYTPGSSLHPSAKIPSMRTQGEHLPPRGASATGELSYLRHASGDQRWVLCAAVRSC